MRRKITPGERFGQELMSAVSGSQETFSGYCRLVAQALLQTAMEAEATEFIGRTSYERRKEDQAVYRNGYKRRKVTTGEGPIELQILQTRDGLEPFQTKIVEAYRRRSETLEALIPQLYVKGLSVRDVSDAMSVVFEDAGVSPATTSGIRQTIQEDFATWQTRSLRNYLKTDPEADNPFGCLLVTHQPFATRANVNLGSLRDL